MAPAAAAVGRGGARAGDLRELVSSADWEICLWARRADRDGWGRIGCRSSLGDMRACMWFCCGALGRLDLTLCGIAGSSSLSSR